MISKEELIKLYYTENLTTSQIGILFKVSNNTISKWMRINNIPNKNSPQKFNHIRNVNLTQLQKEFVIGSMLGDGNINFRKTQLN